MNTEAFARIYNESRNGANHMVRHPLCRQLIYSDGVQELAETGCYWLLDIIGTEVVKAMRGADSLGIKVKVANSEADLSLSLSDDAPPAWKHHLNFTDMPEGEWTFYINNEGGTFPLILPNEY